MFTLLAKLVRKLSRKERNVLADKLVSLAKEETSPDEQPYSPSGGGSLSEEFCHMPQCFFRDFDYSFNIRHLLFKAQERKTFCGIYITDGNGNMKLIVGQVKPYKEEGDYCIDLYMQGYGDSSTDLMCFKILEVPEDWVNEFIGSEPIIA
jgi:hypothetical protein